MATTALPRYGTGATDRPSSSATVAASRNVAPAPSSSSGTSSPAQPRSVASACHSAVSPPVPLLPSARGSTSSGLHRRASSERTLSRSSVSVSL